MLLPELVAAGRKDATTAAEHLHPLLLPNSTRLCDTAKLKQLRAALQNVKLQIQRILRQVPKDRYWRTYLWFEHW